MSWKRTKLLVAGVAVASLVLAGNQAFAVEDAIDVVPAATLLLPYFQVNLADNNGVDTLFSVNNASAAPQIAHITFWTDMSRPTLDFDIYLTGYDVFTVRLGNVKALQDGQQKRALDVDVNTAAILFLRR